MLEDYPALKDVVEYLDFFLEEEHPDFFGPKAIHPILPLKRSKILHDNLWGTNRFTWHELVIIDSPVFQRLRNIHQTGLAFQIYMSAHHTRFEHSLGVLSIASRIFDNIFDRQNDILKDIALGMSSYSDSKEWQKTIFRMKQELRLAALLHDTGHSLFSHSSERVYSKLGLLKDAATELSNLVGKEKKAGEVISFCFAQTKAISNLIERASKNLLGNSTLEECDSKINFENVALIIVGRSIHPFLQFMGDIISSGFDSDKLDYLVRDASNAGLPLQYDFERYLYSVRIEKEVIADDENSLKDLYKLEQNSPQGDIRYPYFDTYRLRIPPKAINTIEQIIICKLMLFSYIYHHPKVRAAEGIFEKMLNKILNKWAGDGLNDKDILKKFLEFSDSSLFGILHEEAKKAEVSDYLYRLQNRLLPREVYGISGASKTGAEETQLKNFLIELQDRDKRDDWIMKLESAIGEELIKINEHLANTPSEALFKTGVWVDVPNPPEFEDVNELVIGGQRLGVALTKVFPIGEWTEAYTHYRYHVRIFSFSDYLDEVTKAADIAMKNIINIFSGQFYNNILRKRE